MAQTIEDVNDRTLLQQFHSLYKKQDAIETNVENVDAKVDKEKSDRQSADAGLQKLIYQEATERGNETASLRNDMNTNTNKIAYNSTQISALQTGKQDKLTAGANITIDENNVISASGGASEGKYQHYIYIKGRYRAHCIIENNQIEAFTIDTLKSYLTSKGYTTLNYVYPVNSSILTDSDPGGPEEDNILYISNVDGLYNDKDNILQLACYGNKIIFNSKDGTIYAKKNWEKETVDYFTDTVTEL